MLNRLDALILGGVLRLTAQKFDVMPAWIIAVGITIAFTVVFSAVVWMLCKKIKGRLFPLPVDKPMMVAVNDSLVEMSDPKCTCGSNGKKNMIAMLKIPVGEKEAMITSAITCVNGEGMLWTDVRIGMEKKSCMFKVAYCPLCGGKIS
jgi:hypothetical protein